MTQEQSSTGRGPEKSSELSEFFLMGKQHIKELTEMQTEVLNKLREANQTWIDRMQAETNLASALCTKLTGARSIPETITAYQEWGNRRMELASEDAKTFLADTQTFSATGVRLLSTGWLSGHPGGST